MTAKANQEAEISRLLMEEPVDLRALRKLSRCPGGFVTNQMRARVWPKLLGVNRFEIPDYRSYIDPHRDDSQVRIDVERSLWRIDKTLNWRDAYREDRRQALCDVIMSVLCRNSDIYYFQGFHDIVSVFLLVLEDDHIAFALTEVVTRDYISDFMNADFEVVGKAMKMLYAIIKASDSTLYRFLTSAKVEPFFATSWLLTWFAHDLPLISDAARVFDAILCSHPLFSYYLCAAYVIHLRTEILSTDCDFSCVHDVLVQAPKKHGFPVEKIITQADALFERTPPEVLKKLCDTDLQKLIYYNQIAAICKPHVFQDTTTSDWALLKAQRVRHASAATGFYLQHGYVDAMRFMGYSETACQLAHAAAGACSASRRSGSPSSTTSTVGSSTRESARKQTDADESDAGSEDDRRSSDKKAIQKQAALSSPAVVAAVLFAGGAIGLTALLRR